MPRCACDVAALPPGDVRSHAGSDVIDPAASAAVVACLAGLLLLTWASDVLVTGAAALAVRLGLSAVTVGVVVIGVGTSAPELLVSGLAAAGGHADVGVATVVGSNITNLTLVLGLAAVLGPLPVPVPVLRREALLTLVATAAFCWFLRAGLGVAAGLALLALLVAATALLVRWGRTTDAPADAELAEDVEEFLGPEPAAPVGRTLLRTFVGLAGTLAGAQALVVGATGLADAAGLSGGVVGVTIIATGTSLPELVTAARAARRGEGDLVLGNVLGSNTVNALAVGATVALVAPGGAVPAGLVGAGVAVLLVVSLAAVGLMRRRRRVTRAEGFLLLAGYATLVPFVATVTG